MKGIKLDLQQAQELQMKTFDGVQFYNPVLDINDEYFISIEELEQTTNSSTLWLKDLSIVDIELKPIQPLI